MELHTIGHLFLAQLKTSVAPQRLETGSVLHSHLLLEITSQITPRFVADQL
jgi:hypothetical protein